MDKKDWIWVAIRMFGIVLVVMAIMGLPTLVVSGLTGYLYCSQYSSAYDDDTSEALSSARRSMSRIMLWTSVVNVGGNLLRVVLFSIIGVYFLRNGKLVFNVIYREETDHDFTHRRE